MYMYVTRYGQKYTYIKKRTSNRKETLQIKKEPKMSEMLQQVPS